MRVRQSEEGGRFYQDANEYRIVEVAPTERIDHPPEYCWVTAEQLCNLVRFSNLLANELRTLVALLRTIPEVGSGSENR